MNTLERKRLFTRLLIDKAGAYGVPLEFLPIPIVRDLQKEGVVMIKNGFVFMKDYDD